MHKRTHTFVAADEAGRKLGEVTVKAEPMGHDKAIGWARLPLHRARTRDQLTAWLGDKSGIDARLARDIRADIDWITPVINALQREITFLVQALAPELVQLPGCGALTAAKIVGETAGVNRFAPEAKYVHAGVAPIPVWSGRTAGRVRMCKSGNRQLNAALHWIAITQIRLDGLGSAYYRKRLDAGGSTTEALRCLKRRLVQTVFNTLRNTPSTAAEAPLAAPA